MLPGLIQEILDGLTVRISDAYEQARLKQAREERARLAKTDPELAEKLRRSNREQARHILEKLYRIGLTAVPISDPRPAVLTVFDGSEQHEAWVDQLAEMEHGRFNVERLFDGWTLGPRDNELRQRPSLIPWSELDREETEKDRESVRAIPGLLASIDYKIVEL